MELRDREPDDGADEAFARAAREERYAELDRAPARLGPDERGLGALYYEEVRPMREIAEITGESLSAVTTRLSRARAKLKDQLTEVY